jgi:hypothetical protein
MILGLPMSNITYVQLRLQDEELAELDRYRRQQSNPPTRPQAALDLVRGALNPRKLARDRSADHQVTA